MPSGHVHEWSALWAHFGPYGDRDAHFHVCLTGEDCGAMLVGGGRDCAAGQEHEVRFRAEGSRVARKAVSCRRLEPHDPHDGCPGLEGFGTTVGLAADA